MPVLPEFKLGLILARRSFCLYPPTVYVVGARLCAGGHRDSFGGGGAVGFGEMGVHARASRMRMNLHEELSDHFASQSLAALGQLRRRLPGAGFARQAGLETELRVIVVHARIQIMPASSMINKEI